MSLRDEEAVLTLLRDERPLDLLDPAPDWTEERRKRELVAISEIAVEAVPGEDLGQILRRQVVEQTAINQFAEDQPVRVEHPRQHVGFFGRVTPAHVAEPVQYFPDAPEHRLDALLLGLGLAQ